MLVTLACQSAPTRPYSGTCQCEHQGCPSVSRQFCGSPSEHWEPSSWSHWNIDRAVHFMVRLLINLTTDTPWILLWILIVYFTTSEITDFFLPSFLLGAICNYNKNIKLKHWGPSSNITKIQQDFMPGAIRKNTITSLCVLRFPWEKNQIVLQ